MIHGIAFIMRIVVACDIVTRLVEHGQLQEITWMVTRTVELIFGASLSLMPSTNENINYDSWARGRTVDSPDR